MKKIIIGSLALMTPFVAMAAKIEDIITTVSKIVTTLIPLFMVIGVAVFLWGIVRYITSAGDEEKQKAARGYIIYGLIGIFIMVAFWGIIQIVANTFLGGTLGGTINLPVIKTK
jgi:fumarate reductase subunit D